MMGWRMGEQVVGRGCRLIRLLRRGFKWRRCGLLRRIQRRRRGEMLVNGVRSLLQRWGCGVKVMVVLLHRRWRSCILVGWMWSGKGRDHLVGIVKTKRLKYIIGM